MSIISKFPRGLLSLLGVQNFGENPREFMDELRGTIDVGEQLELDSTTWSVAAPVALVNGFNAYFTVPQGEVWKLKHAHAGVTTGVGEAVTYMPAINVENQSFQLAAPRTVAASLNDSSPSIVQNIWLPAGARVGVFASATTGAPLGTAGLIAVRVRA